MTTIELHVNLRLQYAKYTTLLNKSVYKSKHCRGHLLAFDYRPDYLRNWFIRTLAFPSKTFYYSVEYFALLKFVNLESNRQIKEEVNIYLMITKNKCGLILYRVKKCEGDLNIIKVVKANQIFHFSNSPVLMNSRN